MKLRTRGERTTFWLALILLAILAIKGLVIVAQFIGYAVSTAQGGTITELILQHNIPTDFWAGVSGISVRIAGYNEQQWEDFNYGIIKEKNLLFNCMQKDLEHEIYATLEDPSTLDIQTLLPMTADEIDTYFGKVEGDFDSAHNTYAQQISFMYGSTTITTAGTVTYSILEDPPTSFKIAVAQTADGKPVFVAIMTNFTKGFNNRTYNYQLLLPSPGNESRRYYFFTDPYDVCGEGEGDKPPTGMVYGIVTNTAGVVLGDVIVEVAGVANLSNDLGNYTLWAPVGFNNIYAYKTGYRTYRNNITINALNATRHDIILEEVLPPNPPSTGTGTGIDVPGDTFNPPQEGVGPGQDVGPGEAPLVPIIQQPKVIEGQDFIVSVSELNRKLRIGQFLQDRIFIYSFKKNPAHITMTIIGENITRLMNSDKPYVDVEPNGKGEFILTIFGVGEVGVYNGTIEIGGDINATIPVNIEVLPRDMLPVEALHLEVETAEKRYYPSDIVRVKTDVRNLLVDQEYPVRLFFSAQSPDGNKTLWTYETNAFVKTAFSLINSFRVPNGVSEGDYIVRVTATYLGLSTGTSTIFHVAVPFWQHSLFGMKYWLWLLILLGIGGIVLAVFLIKRNIDSKKKYHLKVEFDELPKPGPRSIYVGKIAETDKTTYFNLENFKTHTIVAGSTGGGKSVGAQVIIEEALEKGVAVIVFDPTAQWTGMLRPCKDKTMLSLYPLYGMKPTDAKAFNGNIRMISDPREKIDIKKYVKPGEIQVFCGHKLDPKDMDIMVANAIRQIFHANFGEEKLLKVMFVFDEVHRLLPKFGGSGDGFLQIERGCREFRKWGLGILLISQVLSDFVGTIKANINTEIQMRTRDEGDLERIRQKYGEEVLRSLVKATVGSGMVENPAYNRGKPYFVAFKPLRHSVERLSDEEIEQYNTYNDMIDNLFYSIAQLEKEGVDIFDLKLELKLAQDKVKTGNFNMVKIYLEGLTPRIDKQWLKMGKKPEQLVRELVEMAAIKDELKKAQEERTKYEAERQTAGTAGGGAAVEKKEWGWKDDVPPNKILNLKNGMIVINLANLFDEVSAMKDADLPKEFDPEPKQEEGKPLKQPINRFAQWILDATGDIKLAYALAAAKTKPELLATLQLKKDGKPIPDAKPPAWFVGVAAPAVPAVPAVPAAPAAPAAPEAPAATPTTAAAPSAPAQSPAPQSAPQFTPAPIIPSSPSPAASSPTSVPTITAVPAPATTQTQTPETTAPAQVSSPVQPVPPMASAAAAPEPVVATLSPAPVATAKSISTIDSLVVMDENQGFRLENGTVLHGVKELRDCLPRMEDWMFNNHVGNGYNHFADWIRGVFHDDALYEKVRSARTKEEMTVALAA